MDRSLDKVRGIFILPIYLCLLAMMFVVPSDMDWLQQIAQWVALPLLILFFYLNTSIDSKFEKSIFYGISLFALSTLLPLAQPVLGQSTLYLIMATWLIGYFSYARAMISVVSIPSSMLFKHKWIAAIIIAIGLIGIYFLLSGIESSVSIVPWICLGLACIVYFMSAINLTGQLHNLPAGIFIAGSITLICFNFLIGLNISSNISIFDNETSLLFFIGQLLMIFAAVRCCVAFSNNNYTDISSVLNKK